MPLRRRRLCARNGHCVRVGLPDPPQGAEMVMVDARDLFDAVTRLAPGADLLIQAAAPADFKPCVFEKSSG